ncbi:hypothetical protein ACFXPA_01080 [Amycolatopsis sp. NPDC059090]|uniref:hypothetical protein n=1 Tax=unclassified Amycolatopsis TaxID=2618356 RepID=UPI00366A579A
MDGLRERSTRPRTSPNATRAEVIEKIVHLRKNTASTCANRPPRSATNCTTAAGNATRSSNQAATCRPT